MINAITVPYRYQKEVILYQAPVAKFNRRRFLFFGVALLAISGSLFLSFFAPVLWAETRYRLWRFQDKGLPLVSLVSQKHSLFGELLWLDSQGVISPADWDFSLIIPKIRLNTKVVKDVDPASKKVYSEVLKEGVAHAQGSGYPDQEKLVYIFGHSTNFLWNISSYNAFFYLLGKLEEGDKVSLFYQGRHYTYQVSKKEVTSPSNLSSLSFLNGRKLVLSTCWPPGTTWQRLIVTAIPKETLSEGPTFGDSL